MPMLPSNFRADDHGDMNTFDPFPVGPYNMKIVESEMCLTKAAKEAKENGDPDYEMIGQYLKLKFEILDGDHKGKFFYKNFNLINKNEKAVEIANKEFATLCRALDVNAPESSEDLHSIPVEVELKQTGKETDAYGIQNDVKMFRSYEGPIEASSAPAGKSGSKDAAAKSRNW